VGEIKEKHITMATASSSSWCSTEIFC